MDGTQFVSTVLSSIALSTIAVAALAFLSKSWLIKRLDQSIEHEYAKKLEEFRHKLTKRTNSP